MLKTHCFQKEKKYLGSYSPSNAKDLKRQHV